jgi:hypothetical protein
MHSSFATLPAFQFTPEQVVRELRHLPSAPKVLPRLKRLLADGNSSMPDIVALIRIDPGIAARVLQTANSAYYSKGTRCFTVDEAVNRVGYDQVYELVAYAVASQVLVRPLVAYGMEPDELWRSSVACGLAAEMLAGITGEERDVAYTVGLLHCVGMLAIDEWPCSASPRRRPEPLCCATGIFRCRCPSRFAGSISRAARPGISAWPACCMPPNGCAPLSAPLRMRFSRPPRMPGSSSRSV